MRISFHGKVTDEPRVRAGFIGCGSHSFRNIYPTLQFAPVELAATCDLDEGKAGAFARQFGAEAYYTDHRRMLDEAKLDAVFIVTNYDERGRPRYPLLAVDCLQAGCHVWMEKPPAASCAEIEAMQQAAGEAGRHVMVGLKKMFCPANEKAKEMMDADYFAPVSLLSIQYPQSVPTEEEFGAYSQGDDSGRAVIGFLDHLCHPVSVLLFLAGMPSTLYYERSAAGAGVALFRYEDGLVASVSFTKGASLNGGMERTQIVSARGMHIVVENNVRVTLHRTPPVGYGDTPSFFTGSPEGVSSAWEPEFSLGQLYNKGLFLLGYWGEVNEFAASILEGRAPAKCTLEHAWQATRVFEAFAEGPGKLIAL